MSRDYYHADQIDTVKVSKYGTKNVILKDDIQEYFIHNNQRNIPHVIPDSTHPAHIGDMITVSDPWMVRRLGASCVFVSGVRTFKESVRSLGIRQVEILGLPCQWFSIGHFAEYKNKQISSWGSTFDLDRKTATVVDSKGNYHTGWVLTPPILPNY